MSSEKNEGSRWTMEPMGEEAAAFMPTVESMLKKPGRVLHAIREGEDASLVRHLLLAAAGCFLVFGLVVGSFSFGQQLWAAPLKIMGGVMLSALICLPSLYIFSCLTGLDVRAKDVAMVLAAMLCLVGLLLVGFAPVVWIFSQSTTSVAFMGFLALVFWGVAVGFGVGWLRGAWRQLGGEGKAGHLVVWVIIFLLVSLQMSTTLRPIVGPADEFLTGEKKFFMTHWLESMSSEAVRGWE
ncbi:MAG: hypothetical protein AAGD22_11155 [Verrucomicrobiota bacterium]